MTEEELRKAMEATPEHIAYEKASWLHYRAVGEAEDAESAATRAESAMMDTVEYSAWLKVIDARKRGEK